MKQTGIKVRFRIKEYAQTAWEGGALMYYWNYSAARTRVCGRLKISLRRHMSTSQVARVKDLYRASSTPAPPSPLEG